MRIVHVLRKPLSEPSVAANVLKHGTGALNVDMCRTVAGRWPANMVLEHHPDCRPLGTVQLDGESRNAMTPTTHDAPTKFGYSPDRHQFNYDGEAVMAWDCVEGCPVAELDAQSLAGGMHPAGAHRQGGEAEQAGEGGMFGVGNHEGNGVRFGDSGGASRFFKQVGGKR